MSSPFSVVRFTRRKWVAFIAAMPIAASAFAQVTSTVPPQGSPAPAEASATPEARLKKASDDVHAVSDRLAEIELPMDIEPAFSFKA
jgi:hypothetical protein